MLTSVEAKIKEESRNEQQQIIREVNRRHDKAIDSLLNVIEEVDEKSRYGGQFEFSDSNTRGIRVYHTRRVQITKDNRRSLHYVPYDTNAIVFYPKSIVIRTFNNFIDNIHVDGYVKIKNVSVPVTFYNGDFSISLRSIFERKHYLAFRIPYAVRSPVVEKQKNSSKIKASDASKTNPVQSNAASSTPQQVVAATDSIESYANENMNTKGIRRFLEYGTYYYRQYNATDSVRSVDYKTYLVNISDLIKINSYNNHATFMVKNDSYRLDSSQKYVRYNRRTFYDYLNIVTFLDFLGVVEKTPNSLIQIEGRIRLPLRLRTSKFLDKSFTFRNVFFPKLDAYLNASFINGSSADTRFGTIFSPSTTSIDTLYIDNFDLIRKNNIRTGLEMGIWKRELKNSSLNFYLAYGLHFTRTNLHYRIINPSDTDEVRQFNTWSISHGPIGRLEYRPDQNLGMDLSFSYNLNQHLLNSDNDNLRVVELKGPIHSNPFPEFKDLIITNNRNRNNYKIEFNTYFMVRPSTSNGGLYFRLSSYLSHDFKQIFPQVLVGYSTRLNGMVKNLKDKDKG